MRAFFALLLLFAAWFSSSSVALAKVDANAEYTLFYENGKAGLRDDGGKVIIPASFDALGWSDGSFSVVNQVTGYRQKGRWGLINLKKEFVTKSDFETVTSSGGDRIIASKHINPYTIKFGCLDLNGKITIPFMYDGIQIHGLRAIVFVKNGQKYEHGLIDLNDRSILPVRYRDVRPIGSLRFAIQNFDKRTALFSEEGVQLTGFDIDSISAFRKGNAIIYQDFRQGLIDREGIIQVQPIYRELRMTDSGIEARVSDKWKIIDDKNKEIRSVDADQMIPDGNHYIMSLAGKYGTVSTDLDSQIKPEYDHLDSFKNKMAVAKKAGKYGVISSEGKETIPFVFDSLILQDNFLRTLKKEQGVTQWNIYDTFNVKKTSRYYDNILAFNGRFFPVKIRGHWGAVDRYGKEILSCVYDSLMNFSHDMVAVKFKGLYGIVSFEERWSVLPQQYPLTVINHELFIEKQDTIFFLKKNNGEVVYFTNNAIATKDGYLEETTPQGVVRQVSYNGISSVVAAAPAIDNAEAVFEESEGYRGIRRNGQYGFIDSRGRLRIANRYQGIGAFHEGVAAVMILGKWGFVSKQDQIVVNPSFEEVQNFKDGLSVVKRDNRTGVINKGGDYIVLPRYDSVQRAGSFLVLYDKTQAGLCDQKGNVLIEPRFDHMEVLPNNLVIVRDGAKWGVLTSDGMPVIPMIYSFVQYNPSAKHFLVNQRSEWKQVK